MSQRAKEPPVSKLLTVTAGLLLLAGAAAAQTGKVEVTAAWARATPGMAQNGAAYVTLEAATPDRLTGVETPVAAKAELHTMQTKPGGIMEMRPIDSLDLPAGKRVTLKPGAMHIMLMGLKAPLRTGQSFPLTLHFEKAGTQEVTVAVEKVGAMGMGAHGAGMPMHH